MLGIFMFLSVGCLGVYSNPRFFILSPNVLHVGAEEQISVMVYGFNLQVQVELCLQDFPNRLKKFSCRQGMFTKDVPGNFTIKITPDDLPKKIIIRYVYIVARIQNEQSAFYKSNKVLLSYKTAGLVFIQTDKPIYTPKQTVKMRIIPMGYDLKPSKDEVTIVVKNPQGIQVEKWPSLSTDTGFISRVLDLGDFALLGNWTIEVWFGHLFFHNTSTQFEVREYVLPVYGVNIIAPDYVLQTTQKIRVAVVARYTYGKPVVGTVFIRLKILLSKEQSVLLSTFHAILQDGDYQFSIRTQQIKDLPGNIWFPEGGKLQIEAHVTEKATGSKESAVFNSVHFTSSPFQIKFVRTAKHFKPGLPFDFWVKVIYPNKSPAADVPLTLEVHQRNSANEKSVLTVMTGDKQSKVANKGKTDRRGEADFVIDVPHATTELDIKVQTNKDDIPAEQNAEAQYMVTSYYSRSNSFVYVDCKRVKVGQKAYCRAFIPKNRSMKRLMYTVVARGRIVIQDSIVSSAMGYVITIQFPATSLMSPSARIIVYYELDDGEVVADSSLIYVDEEFPNDVQILNRDYQQKYPSENINIMVQATPGTRIGILGVDKSVYLLRNDKRFERKKIFETIRTLDIGCGFGGGKDNREVFMNAGVSVISRSFVSGERKDFSCNEEARRRRRSIVSDLTKCCAMGNEPHHRNHSCLRRTISLDARTFSSGCKVRFFNCCVETHGMKDVAILARSGLDEKFFDEPLLSDEELIEQIQIRSYFPETWLFEEIVVGTDGQASIQVTIPDTITTWVVQAFGVSNTTGFGLASPFNLVAYKKFFVSMKLPFSVQRGEQFSVLVTVFNYESLDMRVAVYIVGDEGFCSVAQPGQSSKLMRIIVKKRNFKSLSFPIVPIQIGSIPIKVVAVDSSLTGGDGLTKHVFVTPEGVERRRTQSFLIDPQRVLSGVKEDKEISTQKSNPVPFKSGRVFGNNKQTDSILMNAPKNAIPDSIRARISITGNLLVVTDQISGSLLEKSVYMPGGCGEQNMVGLAPNVYVLQYLTNTNQLTAQAEAKLYKHIQKGYTTELTFRHPDRSFRVSLTNPASVWLTAFVVRVFCQAQTFSGVHIDPQLVCGSVEWLVANQRGDGAFPEQYWVHNRAMKGGIQGDVGMTAFVLTALLKCRCQNTNSAVTRAASYLENQLDHLNTPYIISLVAYALSLAGSGRRLEANDKLVSLALYNQVKNTRHWNAGGRALNIETAGYALLTQTTLRRQNYAGPIVSWLTEQRNAIGGFQSTQDTCVALEALARYSETTVNRHLNLRVTITAEMDPKWKRTYFLTRQNALLQRREDVTSLLGGELFVDSEGTGVAQMQVEVRHNVPSLRNESCSFALNVEVREERKGKVVLPVGDQGRLKFDCKLIKATKCKQSKDKRRCRKNKRKCKKKNKNKHKKEKPAKHEPIDAIELNVCTRYKGVGKTGMSIVDVGILTGFRVNSRELNMLKNASSIDIVEINDHSVVFYLSEIPSTRDTCIRFKLWKEVDVGAIQQVPVKVYDYYEPNESCTKFFGPSERSVLKLGICRGSQCKCTQDDCISCIPRNEKPKKLKRLACSDYEFALKGKVKLIGEENTWLVITVQVLKIQKQGKFVLNEGQLIEFKKRAKCRCPNLKTDHNYLLMGKNKGKQYILDDSAYVRNWNVGDKILTKFHDAMTKGSGCN